MSFEVVRNAVIEEIERYQRISPNSWEEYFVKRNNETNTKVVFLEETGNHVVLHETDRKIYAHSKPNFPALYNLFKAIFYLEGKGSDEESAAFAKSMLLIIDPEDASILFEAMTRI